MLLLLLQHLHCAFMAIVIGWPWRGGFHYHGRE